MSWRGQAVCRDYPGEVFFPHPGDTEGVAYAVSVCNRCPVREHCAEYALERREDSGIWGGLTEQQRESIRRRTQRLAARSA